MAGGDVQTGRLKAADNMSHYMRLRDSGHLDFIAKAKRCEAFVEGHQWDPSVIAKLQAEGRPALTINKIFPSTMAMMGEQLQNMVDVSFRATASGNEETANALDVSWLHVANSNMLDWLRAEVFDSGAVTGRGYYDMRMTFDDNLRGDIRITRPSNRNVLLDPDADSYDPDKWDEVMLTKWLQPKHIEALYDSAKAKELESRATTDFVYGHDFVDYPQSRFGREHGFSSLLRDGQRKKLVRVMERQYRELVWREHFVDTVTGETRVINKTWDRDRIALVLSSVPDLNVLRLQTFSIRWTVSALDILLFDSESPYKHFTIVPYFPLLLSGATVGLVENQIGPQETINKTVSQELHIVNTTANSGWKVKEGALRNMETYELEEKGAQTGMVFELDDINNLEKIQPNSIPTGLESVARQARQDQQETSLVNKSQLGIDREDVSGKAMERKQLRGPINMGKALANLVRTEHMLARNAVDLIQAFWTEERMLRVTRKNRGQDEDVTLVLNEMTPEGNVVNNVTLGEYHVNTSTVSLREQHEDTEFDQAIALKQLGVQISDEEIIQLSRLRNKKDILERMSTSAEARSQDLDIERQTKAAELEKIQTDNQVSKTAAVERLARTQKGDSEERMKMLEMQAELAKISTQLQLAQNDARRLEIESRKVDAEIEKMRRESRLAAASKKQLSVVSGGKK
jgi:hypothetical protein